MKQQLMNSIEGKRIVWQDGKINTFTIEEILGEDGVTEFKARLAGYKVERIK